MMRKAASYVLFILWLLVSIGPSFAANQAVVLDIDGAIGPATRDYIERGLSKAKDEKANLVILRMDTPGGLDSSMREIIQDILSSPIPVATYVAPSGARAASAGTYILYASHIAAMAPGTNLGAATPVQIGEGSPLPIPGADKVGQKTKTKHPTLSDKAVSDAIAYARGLAHLHGRNAVWIEKAVREAASIPAREALKENVINVIADNVEDLLAKINGREVKVAGKIQTLDTQGMIVVEIEPDWRNALLSLITNPNIAYILLIIGIYGLLFEFMNPGAIAPGVLGGICLLLSLYALQLLPINYAGLALMLLGIAFMVAEAFLPSFGILGFGGIVAFVIGSIMLLDTDIPGFGIAWPMIAGFAGGSALFSVFVLGLAVRARRRPVVTGKPDMIGAMGEVITWKKGQGLIRVHGESWSAESRDKLIKGDKVSVEELNDLVLKVKRKSQKGD